MRKVYVIIGILILGISLNSCSLQGKDSIPDITVNYDESIFENHNLVLGKLEILIEGSSDPLTWTPEISPNIYDVLEYASVRAELTHYLEFSDGETRRFTETAILEKNILSERGNVVSPGSPYFDSLEEKKIVIDPSVSFGNTLKSITVDISGEVNSFHFRWTPGAPPEHFLYLYEEEYTVSVTREVETYKNPSVTDTEIISGEGETLFINTGIFTNTYVLVEENSILQYHPLEPNLPGQEGISIPWNGNSGYRPRVVFTHQSDLIVYTLYDNGFFYKRTGEGIYAEPEAIEGWPEGYELLFAGDCTGDEEDDLIFISTRPSLLDAAFSDYYFLIAPGLGNGAFDFSGSLTSVIFKSWQTYCAVGDINGDREYDIVCSHQPSGGTEPALLNCFFGNGDGTFSKQQSLYYNGSFSSGKIALGDMNGDGRQDIVIGADDDNFDSGQMELLINNGDGAFQRQNNFVDVNPFSEEKEVDVTSSRALLADFNNDGELDLLIKVYIHSTDLSQWIIHLNKGGGEFAPYGSDGIILTPYHPYSENHTTQFRLKPLI